MAHVNINTDEHGVHITPAKSDLIAFVKGTRDGYPDLVEFGHVYITLDHQQALDLLVELYEAIGSEVPDVLRDLLEVS